MFCVLRESVGSSKRENLIAFLILKIGRHEAFFKSKADHTVATPKGKVYVFKKDEMVKIEQSFKVAYSFLYCLVLNLRYET